MSFRTNPKNLRKHNRWLFEVSFKQVNYLRQNFIIYNYIKSFLEINFIKVIHYSSKVNKLTWFVWLTYYSYISPVIKTLTKTCSKRSNTVLEYQKTAYLRRHFFFQKKFNSLTFVMSKCSYFIKKKSSLQKYFYKSFKVNPKFYNKRFYYILTKKVYLEKRKKKLKKKLQVILKNHTLGLNLIKYLNQYFKLNVQLHLKNIKMFIKNSARKLNKILFKQLYFYKKFKFLKDTIYILNIGTYCKSAYFCSEHLVMQLCKLRKQRPIINVATQIIVSILRIRLNIKGCKILISGRLQGRDRKKTFLKVFGLLPLQQFSAKISYSLSQDYNIFGMFGVRVWFYYL